MKAWFETRGCAALLTMRDRGRAGSSPAMTRGRFCLRSPDEAQRNPGRGVDVHSSCPALRFAPCGLRLLRRKWCLPTVRIHAALRAGPPSTMLRMVALPRFTGEDGLGDFRLLPHPEEPAKRASRRMAGRMKTWFETRGCAALLTMRDRDRAGSSPAVTSGRFCLRSPDGAQRNPGAA